VSAADHRRVALAFGAVLKSARDEAHLSQERLAELADIDRTYPSLLERGLRQPTIGRLIAIADALGVGAGDLVTLTVMRLRTTQKRTRSGRHDFSEFHPGLPGFRGQSFTGNNGRGAGVVE